MTTLPNSCVLPPAPALLSTDAQQPFSSNTKILTTTGPARAAAMQTWRVEMTHREEPDLRTLQLLVDALSRRLEAAHHVLALPARSQVALFARELDLQYVVRRHDVSRIARNIGNIRCSSTISLVHSRIMQQRMTIANEHRSVM